MSSILITGASGKIGQTLVAHLKTKYDLTLVDSDFSSVDESLLKGTTVRELDLTVIGNLDGLLEGIDYLIHLADDSSPETDFDDALINLNYRLPYNLFDEAAKYENFVKRIIFASSLDTVGAYPKHVQVSVNDPVRPVDLYGVSKVYLEGLANYFAYNKGQEAIGIRIGNFDADLNDPSVDETVLAEYLSPRDLCQLVDCALTATLQEPFLLVNGLSDNRFPRLDILQARTTIGYKPQDDAFTLKGYFGADIGDPVELDE